MTPPTPPLCPLETALEELMQIELTDPSPELLRLAQIRVIPRPWRVLSHSADGGAYSDGALNVIASVAIEEDGLTWLHVSVTRRNLTLPSYEDLCRVRRLFIPNRFTAIQVFPKPAEHVNIHPTCLHLWACLNGTPLPDFTGGGGRI